jgi:biofilm PGA synthesis protein PgaA
MMQRIPAIIRSPVKETLNGPCDALSVRFRLAIMVLIALLTALTSAAETPFAPVRARESAVIQARSGDPKGALAVLKELIEKFPHDSRLLADAAIVANWAGEDAYVLDLYSRAEIPKDDDGVVEAAARSARNQHMYGLALDLFARAEHLAPDRWQPRLGHAMVLLDQERFNDAEALIKPLLEKYGSEPDVMRGQAYLCEHQQDFACAMAMYQKLAATSPAKNPELHCQLAQALLQLGGNIQAQAMCDPPNSADKLRLLAATGAERVRWSDWNDNNWLQQKAEGEHALTALEEVISSSKPGDAIWRQAQSDHLVALYNLRRMPDVVKSWENLHGLGITVPDYALARVAGAYLQLRHPKEAIALYRPLTERNFEDGSLWSGLAYAQFESEQIQNAFHTIDQAYLKAPAWLQSQELKSPQPNPYHASLGLQAAELRTFADMPADGQRQLQRLLAMAPANSSLGRALAMTFNARGWPLRAMKQEQLANSFDQEDELPVVQDAQILESAGRRKEADAKLAPIIRREGNSQSIKKFLTSRGIERGWQATVLSGYEWSDGQYLGNMLHSQAYLYSPLIGYRWRTYFHGIGDSGKFAAGTANRSRAAAGISYNYDRQSLWGEAGADTTIGGWIPTGAAGAQFRLGDQWRLSAEGDWDNVTDVQLIARLNDVRARSGRASLEWRQSESRSVQAAFTKMLCSDGNGRLQITSSWEQRLLTRPRLQINLTPQLWASENSKDQNRAYFNPKHDASLGLDTGINWITWRHYDHHLLQQFNISAAPYWQEHYGFMGAVSTDYTQRWALTRRLGIVGRFMWNSHPYDGVRERYLDASFGLTWGAQ